jgi:hypothetical protein
VNKELKIGASTFLLTTILVLGGAELLDDDVYFCEARLLAMSCEGVSKYYGLVNGKCLNAVVGNKVCRSGWTKDFVVVDEEDAVVRVNEWRCYVDGTCVFLG